jgi:hypothetical protein
VQFLDTGFSPISVGSTMIRLTQPAGFTDPNNLNVAIPADVVE